MLLNMATEGGAEMALKKKQLEAIELLVTSPYKTYNMISEELGINRETLRRWRNTEEFQIALQARLQETWKAAEALAVNTMINLCSEGDFKASKYILDSLGYAPAQKIEADVSTNINIVIEED